MTRDSDKNFSAEGWEYLRTEAQGRECLQLSSPDGKIKIKTLEAVIEVSGSNEVIATPLTGRPGTVKEFVANKDFEVVISGSFHGEGPGIYPITDVENLIKLLQGQQSVEVVSDHLKMFGITDLVIKSYTVNQVIGFTNRQTYKIMAVSDDSFEVEYREQ